MEPTINQEMIDTTDSLEAVSVMKSMKNFLFWVLLIALLVSQAIFWMERLGMIGQTDGTAAGSVLSWSTVSGSGLVPLSAPHSIAQRVEEVTRQVGLSEDGQVEPAEDIDVGTEAVVIVEEDGDVPDDEERRLELFKLSGQAAGGIVRVANFVMYLAAVLYCLTLLMNLKISLTGKLGGINHISRAFFCSLFLLVFLTPWQVLLPGVLVGAMYLPGELFYGVWDKAAESTLYLILLYARFTGLWLLVVWLLLSAQSRSAKWARATLRRLGMSR